MLDKCADQRVTEEPGQVAPHVRIGLGTGQEPAELGAIDRRGVVIGASELGEQLVGVVR